MTPFVALYFVASWTAALNAPVSAWATRRQRSFTLSLKPSELDSVIDELLDEVQPEKLPSLLGQRLAVLTDEAFLPRLEQRAEDAPGFEKAKIVQLSELVVTFLEEVAERIRELEPKLTEIQAEADADIAEAAEAAKAARAEAASQPKRRAAEPAPGTASGTAVGATSPEEEIDAEREAKAQNRFLLERLLDASAVGKDRLQALLKEERAKLDPGFFAHLQWEVDQQKAAKNRKLLEILEVVVQLACIEAEGGQPEVQLLSSLLQTANANSRQELYQRGLLPATPGIQQAFLDLVTETQLALEKKIFRGEQVDPALLQQLRVISIEATDFDLTPDDGTRMKRASDFGDDSLGI